MQIAVVGANGMLGRYVSAVIGNSHVVDRITRNEFDIEKDDIDSINWKKYDYVINCAGLIKQKTGNFFKINSIFPAELNKRCKLIQISSDCVFSGSRGGYTIYDAPDSTDDYGISKAFGEVGTVIIRTSIIGENNPVALLDKVVGMEVSKGYINHYWNGVTCLELSKYILRIIDSNDYTSGLINYHSEAISKYELCKLILDVYDIDHPIEPVVSEYRNTTLIGIRSSLTIKEQLLEQRIFSSEI